jgi:exodeoxyribonuclease V alpha subunit
VWQFNHDFDNPLPESFIVCDEASMLDAQIAAALFEARRPGAHLLLVGDDNQLPSVGCGRVLYDLIAAGVTHGVLDEVQRNCGSIVRACHAIRHRERFQADAKMNPDAGRNLLHVLAATTPAMIDKTVEVARKLRDRRLVDASNFVILTATNRTREQLNERLREIFNPSGVGDWFRRGDRVIRTSSNSMKPGVHGGEYRIFNGEIGTVSMVHDNRVEVTFTDPLREVLFFKGDDLDLAFCLTTHKSQGSEWDYVAVAIEDEYRARMVTTIGWLYTALSRAKRGCFLIGSLSAAYDMYRRELRRKTFLAERVRSELT